MGDGSILLSFAWACFSLQQVVLFHKKSIGLPHKQRADSTQLCAMSGFLSGERWKGRNAMAAVKKTLPSGFKMTLEKW